MPKKKNATKYVVNGEMQAFDLPKAGAAITLRIRMPDSGKLGTLRIGQGSLSWRPANKQKFERFSWTEVDKKFRRG